MKKDNVCISPGDACSGVPQDSVIGPSPLLIYTNEISDRLSKTVHISTDDVNLISAHANQVEGTTSLYLRKSCAHRWDILLMPTNWNPKKNDKPQFYEPLCSFSTKKFKRALEKSIGVIFFLTTRSFLVRCSFCKGAYCQQSSSLVSND